MMELSDFQRRILGFPAQAFNALGSAMTPDPNATPEQQDMSNARWGTLGQMGAILLAAGQRQSPTTRAAILSRLAGVSSPDELAMNAAQRRLYGMKMQQAQTEMDRQALLRQKLSDPATLKALGISADQAQYLGEDGIRKLLENQALQNTPDALLDRRVKEGQIRAQDAAIYASMRKDDPKWGQIGVNADGQPTYGYIPSWDGTGAPPAPAGLPTQPAAGPAENIPPGVNVPEYRKQRAAEEAKRLALEQTQRTDAGKILPDILRARTAYEAGQEYIGPTQSNPYYRSTQSVLPFGLSHGEDVRADIENKLAAYQNPMIMQSLPPGAASDKDIEQARKGKASISDRSPVAGLASIDQDLSGTLRRMGYTVPAAHVSELLRDIRAKNADGIRQFIEAHQGGGEVVRLLSEAMQ